MTNFDFITTKDFRESIAADYAEMNRAAEAKAWKSVHVLAGSIIEALLVDYLLTVPNPARARKDPLKIDLAELISVCRNEKALTERTADLSSLIRSYRNLIHPGRVVRLQESPPDERTAKIVISLVDIIAEELSNAMRKVVGLTAEQILSKIVNDDNAVSILKHVLPEVHENQRQRLVKELLPERHVQVILEAEVMEDDDPLRFEAFLEKERLQEAYRVVLQSLSADFRTSLMREFVRMLREDPGHEVRRYSKAFVWFEDLDFVPEPYRPMVRDHLFDRLPSTYSLTTLPEAEAAAKYLEVSYIDNWLDGLIRTLVSDKSSSALVEETTETIERAYHSRPRGPIDGAIFERLDQWIEKFERDEKPSKAELVRQIRLSLEIPF